MRRSGAVIPVLAAAVLLACAFLLLAPQLRPRIDVGWLPIGDVPDPTHIVLACGDGEVWLWWEPPEGGADGYRIYFLNYAPLIAGVGGKNIVGENDRPFIEISLSSPPAGFDPGHPRIRLTGLQNGVPCLLGLSAWRYAGGGRVQGKPVPIAATAREQLPRGVAVIIQEGGAYDRDDLREAVEGYLEAAVDELSAFGFRNGGVRAIRREEISRIPALADGVIGRVVSWRESALEELGAFQGWLDNSGLTVPWEVTNNIELARTAVAEGCEKIVEMSGKVFTEDNFESLSTAIRRLAGDVGEKLDAIIHVISSMSGSGWEEALERAVSLQSGVYGEGIISIHRECEGMVEEVAHEVTSFLENLKGEGIGYFIIAGDDLVSQIRVFDDNLRAVGAVSFVTAPTSYLGENKRILYWPDENKVNFVIRQFSRYENFHRDPSAFYAGRSAELLAVVDPEPAIVTGSPYRAVENRAREINLFAPSGYREVLAPNTDQVGVEEGFGRKPMILTVSAHGSTTVQGMGLHDQYTSRGGWEDYCEENGLPALIVGVFACQNAILNAWPETYLGSGVLAYCAYMGGIELPSSFLAYPTVGDVRVNGSVFGDILAHLPWENEYLSRFVEPCIAIG